jgi:integrase
MPRRSSKRIPWALSPEDCAKLREAAQGHRLEALLSLMMATGMRPGEAFALRRADLDLGGASPRSIVP